MSPLESMFFALTGSEPPAAPAGAWEAGAQAEAASTT